MLRSYISKIVLASVSGLLYMQSVNAQTDGVQIDYSVTPPTRNDDALLELNSTTQGMLVPRVTEAQRLAIAPNAAAKGLIVYQNDQTEGFYYWDGAGWLLISASSGAGFIENRTVTDNFSTGQAASFDITGNSEISGTLEVQGQVAVGTVTPTSNTMLTINAHGTNTQRSGIDITMTSTGSSNATGINITSAGLGSLQARGFMYSNPTTGTTNAVWGTGAALTNTNIVSGYTGYRNGSGLSYGVYGINGTNSSYATNANTWAGFLQGRTVISSESSPTSPLGVDLEVRNTTTGAAAPATVSLRQTNSLSSNGTIMANLNFGDNRTTNPQAQIQVIRGAASSSASDLPTSMLFFTTPDASTTLTERMSINSAGTIRLNAYTTNGIVRTTSGNGTLSSGGNISLTTEVTGTLPVANGGTGATTLTGVLKGNGTGAITAMTGTANYLARWTDANTLGIGATRDNGTDVGIGVAPGTYKLNVNGTAQASQYYTSSGSGDIVEVGDDAWITDINSANFAGIRGQQNSAHGGLRLGSNGAAYLYSNGTANIGIGNTTPTNTLNVNNGGTTASSTTTYPLGIQRSGSTDLTLGSDASNAYIQSWSSKPLIINSQGNVVATTGGDFQAREGLYMKKRYTYFTATRRSDNGGSNPEANAYNVGQHDLCSLAAFSELIDEDDGDQSHDVQCNVYMDNSGMRGDGTGNNLSGETLTYDFAYNSKPNWRLYVEAYGSKNWTYITCSAICIDFDY